MITVSATPDRTLVRAAGGSVRHLHVRLVAPPRSGGSRPPVHLAFVIDRSGSMAGAPLELAKQATSDALAFLDERDRMAIVAFDDAVTTLVPPAPAGYAAVAAARERIRGLEPGGSTALAEGWLTGCAHIGGATGDAVARCLLLTDGHANVGETSPTALAHHAAELKRRGVRTTTFGLGAGFSEELLHAMSAAGGGNFYFIEHPAQIRDYFTSELGEALEIVSRDVALAVSGRGVKVDPLVAYTVEARATGAAIQIGDLCADQVVDLVIALRFGDGTIGDTSTVALEVSAAGAPVARLEVAFRFAGHQDNDRQARAVAVDRLVATAYAARARYDAVRDNREGRLDAAKLRLLRTAKKIAGYAGDDPELVAIKLALERDAEIYGRDLGELGRKRAHYGTTSSLKGRDESTGRARRGD
ncbi:MAG: VWA domain-containing protein [Deltaproteobacteria bacterium]|nr:VWA domain-containing protein [Deltaproteobacteria bacterium]